MWDLPENAPRWCRMIQHHFTKTMSVFYLLKRLTFENLLGKYAEKWSVAQVYLLKTAVLLPVGPIDLCCSGCALLTLWTCSVVQTVLLQGLVRKWGGCSGGNWPLPEGTESQTPEIHDTDYTVTIWFWNTHHTAGLIREWMSGQANEWTKAPLSSCDRIINQ